MKMLMVLTSLVVGLQAYAVIKDQAVSGRGSWTKSKVVNALKMPAFNRQLLFKKMPVKAQEHLQEVVFDEDLDMSVRWRALSTIGLYAPFKRREVVLEAANSPQWFLRNGALVTARAFDKRLATRLAKKLSDDDAMVVRAAAVETLEKHGQLQDIRPLWKEMDKKRNFRKGQSLWIRHSIAKALAKIATKTDTPKVAAWLKDKDRRIQGIGVLTLERLVGIQLGREDDSLDAKRKYWLSWWGRQN